MLNRYAFKENCPEGRFRDRYNIRDLRCTNFIFCLSPGRAEQTFRFATSPELQTAERARALLPWRVALQLGEETAAQSEYNIKGLSEPLLSLSIFFEIAKIAQELPLHLDGSVRNRYHNYGNWKSYIVVVRAVVTVISPCELEWVSSLFLATDPLN